MENDFNTTVNISYIDDNLDKPTNIQIWRHYFSSILVYFTIYIILDDMPFFSKMINAQLLTYYVVFILLYIFIAPIFLYIIKPKSIHNSHAAAITSYFVHLFKDMKFEYFNSFESLVNYLKPSYHQQQAIALYFVKVFFGTLMWTGVFNNIHIITARMPDYTSFFNTIIHLQNPNFFEIIQNNSDFIFFNLILFLFTVDLLVFAFGYITELDCLKNKIRSIDTSFAGLFFCLCCYGPLITVTFAFIDWYDDATNCTFGDPSSILTITFRILAIFCLIIYVLASIALGTKASNLTNRGTVSAFPYNIVRHPAYVSKNIFWFLITIPIIFTSPFINAKQIIFILFALFVRAGIYYIRALTEERHLLKDPEYQAYVKKVKYRFIPYIF